MSPLALLLALACRPSAPPAEAPPAEAPPATATVEAPAVEAPSIPGESMSFTLRSPDFAHQGDIPVLHTCQGQDRSPTLEWGTPPAGTQSFALIVDDPDAPDPAAPQLTWVHWVLYNIPASASGLPGGVRPANLPAGTLQGRNDWKRTGYGGPCPPIGAHRYFHKLYALDTALPDLHEPTKAQLESAMQGHILGQTELIGLYQKK